MSTTPPFPTQDRQSQSKKGTSSTPHEKTPLHTRVAPVHSTSEPPNRLNLWLLTASSVITRGEPMERYLQQSADEDSVVAFTRFQV